MALFGSGKKSTSSVKKIRPTIVRTKNVAKELVEVAKSYSYMTENLDFNILEVQTFTRMNPDGKESDWEEIEQYELDDLNDDTALLNPHFQMMQMYEIEIFSKDKKNDPYRNFNIAVGANATKCKVYMSIKEGSSVEYNERFDKELLIMINKAKVRAGILINIFDGMLHNVVSKISADVRVEESVRYDKTETHLIAQSPEPTLTKDDEIILHFSKKEEVDDKTRVDYAARGFIQSVHKGELLIEYIKAKEGSPGRNCRGEYIRPKEPETKNAPTFHVDDTIKMVETDENITYIARENGYISFENNTYSIKTDVDVGEISFKTTGSISTGLDSDVSISVTEADAVKDAVGTGMIVEVSEIHVEGNVGSSAKVHALKAKIDGQTHKTSEIRADEIIINNHKGSAYGKNIQITRLEHGHVDGEVVDISQAIGGEIHAKEVDIESCGPNVKITASKLIEVKKLQGGENVFVIDPLLSEDARDGYGSNEELIKELEQDIKSIKKEVERYTKLVEDNKSSFEDVKKRLLHYKKNGVKMPASFVKQYKEFKKTYEHLLSIKKEYLKKRDQLIISTTKTATFQEDIFNARIINRGTWIGHNEIKFKLIEPPIELSYSPLEGSEQHIFAVVEVDDEEFEIRSVDK